MCVVHCASIYACTVHNTHAAANHGVSRAKHTSYCCRLGLAVLLDRPRKSIITQNFSFEWLGVCSLTKAYLWKSSMQWIWFVASTVNGMPSRLFPQTTQEKHCGWYGFPVARKIRSNIGFMHTQHFSKVFCTTQKHIQGHKIKANPIF